MCPIDPLSPHRLRSQVSLKNLLAGLKTMEVELAEKNKMASLVEAEIHRKNASIQRKQTNIDQLNKKLEAVIALVGGVEIGPLEIQVYALFRCDYEGVSVRPSVRLFVLISIHMSVQKTKENDVINL